MKWTWNEDDQLYESGGRFEIERDGHEWMLCDGDKLEVLDLQAEGNCKWFGSLEEAKAAAERELTRTTTGWRSRWLSVARCFSQT